MSALNDRTRAEGPPRHPLWPRMSDAEKIGDYEREIGEQDDKITRLEDEVKAERARSQSLQCDLDAAKDELEHAERKLAGEWPYGPEPLTCPRCSSEIQPEESGSGVCAGCGARFTRTYMTYSELASEHRQAARDWGLLSEQYADLRAATLRLLRLVGSRCGAVSDLTNEERGAISLATALTAEKE